MSFPRTFTDDEAAAIEALLLQHPLKRIGELMPLVNAVANVQPDVVYRARRRLVRRGKLQRLPVGQPRKDGTLPELDEGRIPGAQLTRKQLLRRIKILEADVEDLTSCETALVQQLLTERLQRRA